jgi:hypothetical protein
MPEIVPIPAFPNVPLAPGIPAMDRPTAAINAVLNGPTGVNATLANAAAVQSIIGGLTNAGSLFANVPGAQQLLSLSPAAQILLYRVPGFSTLLKDAQAAQALFQTAQGLGSLLANVLPVQRLIRGPVTNAAKTAEQPWGIFGPLPSNDRVAIADAVIRFEFMQDWKIMDYPIEGGSFTSYNKVQSPFTARVVLAKGGTLETVTAFLTALQKTADDLELYSVSTPQFVYKNVNITHIDWSQEVSRGAYLLQTSVWLQQIRKVPKTAQINIFDETGAPQVFPKDVAEAAQPASASAAIPSQTGPVQAQPPTPPQGRSISGAVGRTAPISGAVGRVAVPGEG